jgi:transcription antitermination factor NusG
MVAESTHNDREDGWLVVWTESRAERKVGQRISAQGIEHWVPAVTERHRWSDRWKEVVVPLFPGYVFARAGAVHASRLLRVPGVLTLVKAGGRPAMLTNGFVQSLRRALLNPGVEAVAQAAPHDYCIDDEVVVQEGPLTGLRGVVRQLRSGAQLVIWVQQIGRGVGFRIGAGLVARRAAGCHGGIVATTL